MSSFIITMIVILLVAVGIFAMVAVGMQGHYRDRNPGLAKGLARAARHLNGDAPPPEMLEKLADVTRHRA